MNAAREILPLNQQVIPNFSSTNVDADLLRRVVRPVLVPLGLDEDAISAFVETALFDRDPASILSAADDLAVTEMRKRFEAFDERSKFSVNYYVKPDDQLLLTEWFPEYSLDFSAARHLCDHALFRVMRQLEHRRIAKLLVNYPRVIDVGGSQEMHASHFLSNVIHLDAPRLDMRDISRHLDNPVLTATRDENPVKVIAAARRQAIQQQHPFICDKKAQDCRVPADALMFVQSTYDIDFPDLGSIMDAHSARVGIGSMLLPEELLEPIDEEIVLPSRIVLCPVDNRPDLIHMGFEDSASYTYTHNRDNLVKYMYPSVIVTPHAKYIYSVDERRGPLIFFSIRVLDETMSYDLSNMRRYTYVDKKRTVIVHTYAFDHEKMDDAVANYRPVQYEIDRDIWLQVLQYAGEIVARPQHDPQAVTRFFRSIMAAVRYNGQQLSGTDTIIAQHVPTLATAAYCYALQVKFENDRYLEAAKLVIDGVRQDADRNAFVLPFVKSYRAAVKSIRDILFKGASGSWISALRQSALDLARSRATHGGLAVVVEEVPSIKAFDRSDSEERFPVIVQTDRVYSSLPRSQLYFGFDGKEFENAKTREDRAILEAFMQTYREAEQSRLLEDNDRFETVSSYGEVPSYRTRPPTELVMPVTTLTTDAIARQVDGPPKMTVEEYEELKRPKSSMTERAMQQQSVVIDSMWEYIRILRESEIGVLSEYTKFCDRLFDSYSHAPMKLVSAGLFDINAGPKNPELRLVEYKYGMYEQHYPKESNYDASMYSVCYDVVERKMVDMKPGGGGDAGPYPETAQVESRWYIFGDATMVFNYSQVEEGVAESMRKYDPTLEINIEVINAVAGAGKTYQLLQKATKNTVLLTQSRSSKEELASELSKKFTSQYAVRHRVRTLDSRMIHRSMPQMHIDQIFVDEAFLAHFGIVIAAIVFYGQHLPVMFVGDHYQIPFIARGTLVADYAKLRPDVFVPKDFTFLGTTFRVPLDATCALRTLYSRTDIDSRNNVVASVQLVNYRDGVPNIPGALYVTFTHAEKHDLDQLIQARGYKPLVVNNRRVSTVHQVQGLTAAVVVVVRHFSLNDDIYNSIPHCIVAGSRHTHKLIYCHVAPKKSQDMFRDFCKVAIESSPALRQSIRANGDASHTEPYSDCKCRATKE